MAKQDKEMSFLEHLEELRWHLVRSIVAILIFAVGAFIFRDYIYDYVIFAPLKKDFITYQVLCDLAEKTGIASLCISNFEIDGLQNLKMGAQFTWAFWSSIIIGLIVAFPYIAWEFWRFIGPALKDTERKQATGIVFFTSLLFLLGVGFGYFVLAPLTVNFFATFKISEMIRNDFDFGSYVSMINSVVLWTGIVFELPMLIYFLARIGLISARFLKKYRRHAIVLNLILSAIITPPDIASQIIVALPLSALYEIGIMIASRVERKRALAESRQLVKS